MKNTNDPLERLVAETLDLCGLAYTCPDQQKHSGYTLDFHITSLNIFIECKAYGTTRLHSQIENVSNCIILIGMPATRLFCDLLKLNYISK